MTTIEEIKADIRTLDVILDLIPGEQFSYRRLLRRCMNYAETACIAEREKDKKKKKKQKGGTL